VVDHKLRLLKLVDLVAPKIDDALAGDYRHTLRYVEQFA